jgi:hypothetical protein
VTFHFKWHSSFNSIPFWVTFHLSDILFWVTFYFEWN